MIVNEELVDAIKAQQQTIEYLTIKLEEISAKLENGNVRTEDSETNMFQSKDSLNEKSFQIFEEYKNKFFNSHYTPIDKEYKESIKEEAIDLLNDLYRRKEILSRDKTKIDYEEAYLLRVLNMIWTSHNTFKEQVAIYFPNQSPNTLYTNAQAGYYLDIIDSEVHSFLAEKVSTIDFTTGETKEEWRDYTVSALYKMHSLTREEIKKLHDDKIINPEMTQKELSKIVK